MTGSVFLERRCANARALGSAALDGGLSAFEQRLLDDHLDTCPDCAAVVAEMGRVTALVRATPVEAPTVLAAPARPAKGRRLGWAARASIAVASLAVAAGLGLMAGASRTAPEPHVAAARSEQPSLTQVLAMTRIQHMWRASLPRSQRSPHGRIL